MGIANNNIMYLNSFLTKVSEKAIYKKGSAGSAYRIKSRWDTKSKDVKKTPAIQANSYSFIFINLIIPKEIIRYTKITSSSQKVPTQGWL